MHPLSGDTSTIDLTEGGSLGVAAFGDPDGIPCFAFHGTASSRLMPGWMFPTELLTAAGVRMIGVDRAGYGLSTMPKVQRFSDWPSVVEALADHLGIGRFAVLAHSLGSAFALACGTALGDRLTVIVILSGMGPLLPNQRFRARSRADNLYWWLARHQASWLLNSMCGLSASMMLRSARGDSQRFLSGLAKQLPEEDRLSTQRVLARAGTQQILIDDLRESYRQGTKVMATDLLLYSRPWGINLQDVTTAVELWHGEQDAKVPISVARQMAADLLHCKAHYEPGGHLMACDHGADILRTSSAD